MFSLVRKHVKHIAITTTIIVALFAFVPTITHGADITFPYWGPLVTCSGGGAGSLPPCTSVCDLLETFQAWVYFFMTMGVLVLVPVMLAIGGITLMISGTNKNLLEKGKSTITGAVVGLVIILSAFVIINTFIWLVTGVSGGNVGENNTWYDIECEVPPVRNNQ